MDNTKAGTHDRAIRQGGEMKKIKVLLASMLIALAGLSIPAWASIPLTLPAYNLDATSTVQVKIVSNYYTAQVNFYNGALLVYTLTLIQQAPYATLPPNLKIGGFTIQSGTLTLQIPSPIQQGTVTLNCTYTDMNVTTPKQLNAVIGRWNLNQ